MRPALLTPTQYMITHRVRLPVDGVFPESVTQCEVYGAYYWELENICLFQQAAHTAVSLRNERLDAVAAENKEFDQAHKALVSTNDDEREGAMLAQSRRWEQVLAEENTLETIEAFNAELTTIAIWTVIEKTMVQMLAALEASTGETRSSTVRFDVMQQRFFSCGVDLVKLSGFADVDECRCVNNAIKHGGKIGTGLASFPRFAGLSGTAVRRQTLDVQRYLFGAHTFLGSVLPSLP